MGKRWWREEDEMDSKPGSKARPGHAEACEEFLPDRMTMLCGLSRTQHNGRLWGTIEADRVQQVHCAPCPALL